MACYHPVSAYQCADGSVTFTQLARHDIVRDIKLPCRGCIGCRLERSRQWGLRVTHESQLHDANCWLTLTYEKDPVTLVYRDVQLFLKRMRKAVGPFRFYLCGEYGSTTKRPHWHVCIFGYDFPLQMIWSQGEFGPVNTAPLLSKLWPLGLAVVGRLTPQSAAYTARYCVAKITGDLAEVHYAYTDPETGEQLRRTPELNRMSTRPGIGAVWFARHHADVFPHDYAIQNGSKLGVPEYYARLLKRTNPDQLEDIKSRRGTNAIARLDDNTPERLATKEVVKKAKTKSLVRTL